MMYDSMLDAWHQVVLVHGAESLMRTFLPIVRQRLRVACHAPGVGELLELPAVESVQVRHSNENAMRLLERA